MRDEADLILGKAARACLVDFFDYISGRSVDDLSLKGGNEMKIEMTPQQACNNIDLLGRLADLYGTEAAALATLDCPVARELAEARLDAIGQAQELIALLSGI